jgi:prolyl oligopeptidase
MTFRLSVWVFTVMACLVGLCLAPSLLVAQQADQAEDNGATAALAQLLEDDWEWRMDNFPTWATFLGDRRAIDQWEDMSHEAIELRKKHPHELLERLKEIPRDELSEEDQLNYDLFRYNVELDIEGQAFPTELLAIDQLDGPQLRLGQVAEVMPLATVADYENYIARLR